MRAAQDLDAVLARLPPKAPIAGVNAPLRIIGLAGDDPDLDAALRKGLCHAGGIGADAYRFGRIIEPDDEQPHGTAALVARASTPDRNRHLAPPAPARNTEVTMGGQAPPGGRPG